MPTKERAPTSVHKLPGRFTALGVGATDTGGGTGLEPSTANAAELSMDKPHTIKSVIKRFIIDLQPKQCPAL
jgi:hypothetical protein